MTIKPLLKLVAQKSIITQRLYRWYRRRQQLECYPDWENILSGSTEEWQQIRAASQRGPKVLIASLGGLPTAIIMDSLLAVALTLRGADVHLLLCDSALPACLMAETGLIRPKKLSRKGTRSYFCEHCYSIGESVFKPLGLKLHRYSDFITQEDISSVEGCSNSVDLDRIGQFESAGIPLGEHALAGTLRYFAQGSLNGQPWASEVLKQYLKASFLTQIALQRLMGNYHFEAVSCINGIYVPQGIVASVARATGCRVAAWNVAYRKKSFIFSHGDTYHHTLMNEPPAEWENLVWSETQEKEIMDYLSSRRRGGRDWIVFLDKNSHEDLEVISNLLDGIDFSKPCIGLLTNVAWDAQLHYPANVFANMVDWVVKTIQYFVSRRDLQLIVRVHPAEVSGDIPSRQPVVEELKQVFPKLPKNIFIIPPQSKISTYTVMEVCNAVLIYGTKTGVELTSRGIPVIVAGEAWIRNKGITIDAKSTEHYFQILDQLPFSERMSQELTQRARKYAYHFFFRRMVPVSQTRATGGSPKIVININGINDLLPGKSKGLDIICDGILQGTPFSYPAEIYGDNRESN